MRPEYPYGATDPLKTAMERIYRDMNAMLREASYFPPFLSSNKPNAALDAWRYRGVYYTDLSRPAWSDGTIWRYSDGTAVP